MRPGIADEVYSHWRHAILWSGSLCGRRTSAMRGAPCHGRFKARSNPAPQFAAFCHKGLMIGAAKPTTGLRCPAPNRSPATPDLVVRFGSAAEILAPRESNRRFSCPRFALEFRAAGSTRLVFLDALAGLGLAFFRRRPQLDASSGRQKFSKIPPPSGLHGVFCGHVFARRHAASGRSCPSVSGAGRHWGYRGKSLALTTR